MKEQLLELIHKIEICREGKCYECEYFNKYCTDDLIDDIYVFLLEELENGKK